MENQSALPSRKSQEYTISFPSIWSGLRPIAVGLLLCAAVPLCLFAQEAESIPQQTGATAHYLGNLESDSTAPDLPLARPLAITANPPTPAVLSFNAAEVGVAAASAQQLTASFSVSGYSGNFTPTATLHYGHDYTIGAVTCTPSGASETCNVPVVFRPSLPGARKDAIFLMDGATRLATVLLSGVGTGPLSLVQPGAFSTSVPTTNYIYQSVADENGVVYILPNGNTPYIERVTKAGVATQIPLTNPPYFWTISIDGAGVLYLFNETSTVTTYDTVQGIQGTYQIPPEPLGADPTNDWFPGALGADGSIYVVNQIRNNGVAYVVKPDGTTAYAVTFNPGVLQPFTAAVDSAGNFFVGGYEINKITPAGVQTQVNTVGASAGLAVDAADTLYATRYIPLNDGSKGVAMLPASDYSTPEASIDGRQEPLGMSLGSDGTVYVSNYVNLDIFDRSTTEVIDFGEVDAGKSSTVSIASVYNGGNQPLTISQFSLAGEGFSLDPNASKECAAGAVLAPGALCQASVVFAPTHPGSFSATIAITSNSLNGINTAQTIQLVGTSDGSYDVLSPNPLVFAAQAPGTSQTLAVTMTNEGNFYASTIYSVATDNPAFTITQGTCSGVAVQVGASCQLQVTFTPAAVQAYSGTATIVTYVSGSGQASQTIALPLSGTSTNPPAATPVFSPAPGTYSSSQQVTISDTTPGATIYYTTDGSAPSASSTKYSGAIAVNSSETLKAIAAATGYSNSAVASASYTLTVPVLSHAPASLDFGTEPAGSTSTSMTVTVTNIGSTYALNLAPVLSNTTFAFASGSTCGSSVAPGASCLLKIDFTPAAVQAYSATVTIAASSPGCAGCVFPSDSFTVTGTGIAQPPVLTISPATLNFGNQIVNTSATLQTTVTNISKTDTVVLGGVFTTSSIALTASGASCSSPLAPGTSCTVSVTFSPSAIQAFTGTVTLQPQPSGCGGCTRNYPAQSIAVIGTGINPPPPTFAPASLSFRNQVVGTVSASQTMTLTNPAAAGQPITVEPFNFAEGTGSFAQNNNCPHKLAAGSSCQILVFFEPGSVGAISDQLELNYLDLQGLSHFVLGNLTGAGITQPPVLTFSPTSLDFGNVAVNTSSAIQSFTVTNSSKTDTVVISSIADTSSAFYLQPSSCGSPTAPGTSCTISLIFAPKSIEAYSASVIIQVQPAACGGCVRNYPEQTFTVTGTGTGAILAISPSSLAFGNKTLNQASAAQTITLTNSSTTESVKIGKLSSSDSAFAVDASRCSSTISPGASCVVSVAFTPSAPKPYIATASIQPIGVSCPSCSYPVQTLSFSGTGVTSGPVIVPSPASLDFGSQLLKSFTPLTVTLTNSSKTETVAIISPSPSDPAFLYQVQNCANPVAPGASCALEVTFSPAVAQAYNARLTFSVVDPNCSSCALPAQSIVLTGTGTYPAALLLPESLTFKTAADTTSAAQIATLSNTGSAPLTIASISISSFPDGLFNETNNCGASLAVGASCSFSITFAPVTPSDIPGALTVKENPGGLLQVVNLHGTAPVPPPPVASLTPASLSFTAVAGTTSAAQTATLSNTGGSPLAITAIAVTSSPSGLFNAANNCGASLAAGASCSISVTFSPVTAGSFPGAITVTDNATVSVQSTSLTGTATPAPLPVASLAPASLSFSATVGTTSAQQTATLSNTGKAPLDIFGISITGASPNDYRQTTTCGSFLAVGASCAISVTFTPEFPGSYPATLTVADNDPTSPQTISLTGSGTTTPDFVVASSTPPQTILPGGSAQFSLTVTAQNGASIPAVNLAATGLPPGATATFSHSAVTPGSTSATSTLTIKTSTTSAAAVIDSAWPLATPALALAGFFFIPAKRRRRWAALGVLTIVSLGALSALSGCGGSTLPPAKSYTVTITGTIGTVQQTTTVQLTVR